MGQLTDLHAPPDNVTDKRLKTWPWRGGPKKEKKKKKILDDTQLHLHNSPIPSNSSWKVPQNFPGKMSTNDIYQTPLNSRYASKSFPAH